MAGAPGAWRVEPAPDIKEARAPPPRPQLPGAAGERGNAGGGSKAGGGPGAHGCR